VDIDLSRKEERLIMEIPRDMRTLKEKDLPLACQWRLETREIFEHYFQQGYVASEFLSQEDEGQARSYYVLEKAPLANVLKRKHFS
jgi:predicted GNAT superfamily acetyltransferase